MKTSARMHLEDEGKEVLKRRAFLGQPEEKFLLQMTVESTILSLACFTFIFLKKGKQNHLFYCTNPSFAPRNQCLAGPAQPGLFAGQEVGIGMSRSLFLSL